MSCVQQLHNLSSLIFIFTTPSKQVHNSINLFYFYDPDLTDHPMLCIPVSMNVLKQSLHIGTVGRPTVVGSRIPACHLSQL
jgi:hypothetical protein